MEKMMLIIASEQDPAARNARDMLLELLDHDLIGNYEGLPIYGDGRITLASIPGSALELDHPDRKISKAISQNNDPPAEMSQPDLVVYLSRHQSVSGMKTLTVHPIGNFGIAEYGGNDRTLVPSAPQTMSTALRILSTKEVPGFECTFEATHHGPSLEKPTFFIEIGSTLEEWNDPNAIRAIAETMAELIEYYRSGIPEETGTCIGLGGGHYVPRHTKYAIREGLDFGHMMPSYARGNLDQNMAQQMIDKTPGVERLYIHGKKHRKESRVFKELDFGIDIVEY